MDNDAATPGAVLRITGLGMYEISTRPWLYALSIKYKQNITTLAEVPQEELVTIAGYGVDYVWMMGVWSLGPYGLRHDRTTPSLLQNYAQVLPGYTLEDVIGSPYAITVYSVNPELGTSQDLSAFRARLNALGLKLMLDFVPNHSAVDAPETTTRPELYVRSPDNNNNSAPDPARFLPSAYNHIAFGWAGWGASWTDTAQFNYWNPATRDFRVAQLLEVAAHADAIRCDMAFLVLNDQIQQIWGGLLAQQGYTRPETEFWTKAITQLRGQYPDVIMLAEVYSPWQEKLQSLGFDYTYDKQLYDKLAGGHLDTVRSWLTGQSYDFTTHSAHFVSNHDEPRAAAFFSPWYRANTAALLTYTLPGMRFYFEGVEKGLTRRLDVHLRREVTELPNNATVSLYNTLFSIVRHPVFRFGQWEMLEPEGDTAWRLVSYQWTYRDERRLVVINYSDESAGANVKVPNALPRNGNDTLVLTDLLSGQTYTRSSSKMRSQGLFVIVSSWYAQIFTY